MTSNLISYVSGGIGRPVICLESNTGSLTILPMYEEGGLKEFYKKEYCNDGEYTSGALFLEANRLLGFRYVAKIKWRALTANQIRSIQTILNSKESIRFYPHEDNMSTYYNIYLSSNYTPEWAIGYYNDILKLSIEFTSLEITSSIPYTSLSATSYVPVEFTNPTKVSQSSMLNARIYYGGGSEDLTGVESIKESFEPIYKLKTAIGGRKKIYLKGWRYKALISFGRIDKSMYDKLVTYYNYKTEIGFTPRRRDWDTSHYTCRFEDFELEYLGDIYLGYTGSVSLIGRELLPAIDFYPAPSITVTRPNGGETFYVNQYENINWTGGGGTVTIQIKRGMLGVYSTIVSGVNASLGTYSWLVTGPTNPQCLIKIYDTNGHTDYSDNNFAIVNPS